MTMFMTTTLRRRPTRSPSAGSSRRKPSGSAGDTPERLSERWRMGRRSGADNASATCARAVFVPSQRCTLNRLIPALIRQPPHGSAQLEPQHAHTPRGATHR
eukprot:6200823-Pleurochrysis_carterae.AAC.2